MAGITRTGDLADEEGVQGQHVPRATAPSADPVALQPLRPLVVREGVRHGATWLPALETTAAGGGGGVTGGVDKSASRGIVTIDSPVVTATCVDGLSTCETTCETGSAMHSGHERLW